MWVFFCVMFHSSLTADVKNSAVWPSGADNDYALQTGRSTSAPKYAALLDDVHVSVVNACMVDGVIAFLISSFVRLYLSTMWT